MLLAIDVGDTQTVIGVYREAALVGMWRVATNKSHTADEVRIKLLPLFESAGLSFAEVRGAALASVVPQLTQAWTQALHDLTGAEALVCSAETAAAGGLFRTVLSGTARNRCRPALRMRWPRTGALRRAGGGGGLRNGHEHRGDRPGRELRRRRSSRRAWRPRPRPCSRMPRVWPPSSWPIRTRPSAPARKLAIQAGIVYGEADRVDGLVRRIFAQLGYEAPVVATGGLATCVASFRPPSRTSIPN